MISSLDYRLSRSMLFNLPIFRNFPGFFLLLISNSVVIEKHTLHELNPFKCIETCFRPRHGWALSNHMCLKERAFAVGGKNVCAWQLGRAGGGCCQVFRILVIFSPNISIHHWEWGVEISSYNCWVVYYLLIVLDFISCNLWLNR